ncbi:MAG: DUF3806 domain-containing protein [Luminiphilus sp.]
MGQELTSMVSQLSTSECVVQPQKTRFSTKCLRRLLALFILPALSLCASWSVAQSPNFDVLIEPLTAVDRQFMAEQRMRVEQLANRLGRGLTGVVDRDLDTLQRILDERMVPAEDTLTLQAMGLVFGDLLGERLDMDWVVYRDSKGRSRALRYRQRDVYLFPVTMISRRQEGGSERRLKPLFDDTVRDTRPLLPGGKWFQ